MRVPAAEGAALPAARAAPVAQPSHWLRLTYRLAEALPWPWGEELMGALWMGWGTVMHPRRIRSARGWAAAQPRGRGPGAATRLALSLLRHEGRKLAVGALVGVQTLEAIRERTVVEGMDHLAAVEPTVPTILLGFHVGLPQGWLALRARGRDVVFVGRRTWPRKAHVVGSRSGLSIPRTGGATARLSVLATARRLLLDGRTLWMSADGAGDELFQIPLPGGPLTIRAGWFALRRHTGAVTLPILTRRARRRRVVVLSPPLPPPMADVEADLATCRAALTALVQDFVRSYPEQCTKLALREGRRPGAPPESWQADRAGE